MGVSPNDFCYWYCSIKSGVGKGEKMGSLLVAKENRKIIAALRGEGFLLAFSGQGRSAGPEVGRGVPTPPSLPLDSTHPATGQGLHALDDPKEVGYTGKN